MNPAPEEEQGCCGHLVAWEDSGTKEAVRCQAAKLGDQIYTEPGDNLAAYSLVTRW